LRGKNGEVWHHYAVKFQDPEIQKVFDGTLDELRALKVLTRGLSDEDLQVVALMSVYCTFRLIDHGESARMREITDHLLSLELRPALKSYYRRRSECDTTSFIDFRDRLSDLAGEKLV
jgi:hypothetical protein